ncbi:baseplate hub protein [Yersinia enterocolitica]|uniref:baseplate hub protein n=1 Tax=Yersinia enterocolitica TaxID=630 RepID=UPI003D7A1632
MTLYKQRSLRFEFVNETLPFDDNGNNTISISNVKSTVSCQSSGNLFGTQVNVSIFGLSMDMLSALSSRAMGLYGSNTESISMKIFVENTAIFVGRMTSSIANMNQIPNSALMITATANADLQNKIASPFSFNGSTSIKNVIEAICKSAGYSPIINGLNGVMVNNPHYEGSMFQQLEKICYDLNISMSVTPPNISFWETNTKRDDVIPFISPESGLIGYPIFSNGGVMFQTQFSTLLTTGRNISLKTSLPHADGEYNLSSVTHELSSWMPDGPWHSICIANKRQEEAPNG